MEKYRQIIAKKISEVMPELDVNQILDSLEIPKDNTNGDLAFPCFFLAKTMRKNPMLIATELQEKLGEISGFRVEGKGAYLNFFILPETLVQDALEEILTEQEKYGQAKTKKNERILVEYSSANISKELHIGHIRGIMIGLSLSKIYKNQGYEVVSINHLGDYGINFGKMITAYKKWGNKEDVQNRGVRALLDLYVKFSQEVTNHPELMDEAREWFLKLEDKKDPHALELWQWFKDVSLKEYNRVYKRLGASFDSYAGESFYSDKMPAVLNQMREINLLSLDKGAQIIDLSDEDLPNAVIETSAGTSLYITRDIAAAIYRKKTYNFSKCLYVVGSEQRLHFEQLKSILKKMGYDFYEDIVHVAHGLIMTEEGKISSREKGKLFLEDFLNLAVEKTKEIIEQKNPTLENKDQVAEEVGVSAIAYNELSTSVSKDYLFSWESALSFEGETGPYLQYANVRANSLLEGNELKPVQDYSLISDPATTSMVRELIKYPESIAAALEKNEPAMIARCLMKIAKEFNRFYQNVTINTSDEKLRNARLSVVQSVHIVLENGMYLLNMKTPKKM